MTSLERSTGSRRLGWVSLVGVLLVPIMLAAGFLAATWNSSSRWHKIDAAVVNLDEPVKINGQTVPLGRQLAGGLVEGGDGDSRKADQNFAWVLTDSEDAGDGLADGRYAAVVTIPKDFSARATSYSHNNGDKAQQATLDVQTSKVSGVTDSAVGDAISATAVSALNTELTKQYLSSLYVGFNQTQQGISKSAAGASDLAGGTRQLSSGIGQSATGADKLADGMDQLSNGTKQLSDGLTQTDTGTQQLATGTAGLAKGIRQTDTGVSKLDKGVAKLDKGAATFSKGVSSYADGVRQYTGGVGTYSGQVGDYADGVNQYAGGVKKFINSVAPATGQIADSVAKSVTAQGDAICRQHGLTGPNCEIFKQGLKAGADGTAQGTTTAVRTGLIGSPDVQQLKSSSTSLQTGSSKLSAASDKIGGSGDQLAAGGRKIATGAEQLATGISGLHDGTGKLATGTGKLAAGADKLSTGAGKLADGTSKLAKAGGRLAVGTQQSADGARQLSEGLTKLDGGGVKLADGSRQLADGLQKAADQLPSYSKSDRRQLAKVVSSPVTTDQPDSLFANETTTTLLMALALWIGGLATYLVVRAIPATAFGSTKSSARLALEGIAPGAVIGAIQAVLLSVMLGVLLDLSIGRTLTLLGFGVFAAVTFAALNHALVAWLGGVGRFVSLAVAVLAAAGSLTNALPGFFTTIRPYLPTTPALDGIRLIVTHGPSAGSQFGVLLAWLVIGAVAGILAVARRRMAPSLVPVTG
jgi:putative membrane protein